MALLRISTRSIAEAQVRDFDDNHTNLLLHPPTITITVLIAAQSVVNLVVVVVKG